MNAYYYPPQHVGMTEFPPGYFKLGGFDVTDDPSAADCFVLPTDIRHVTDREIRALPCLKGNEKRHIFFSLAEYPTRALPIDTLAFRTDHNRSLEMVNSLARSWCWGVENLQQYIPVPEGEFKYEIHAQLWASSPITDLAVDACVKAGLQVHDQRQDFFYGTLETNNDPRLATLRNQFLQTMSESRLVLVPRSRAGVNRYRFFEAMSMGRVPVLLCDDCLLPCADKIDYGHCCIRIQERDAVRTGSILREWLRAHTGHELIQMGLYGRAMWERWLAPARWEQTWGELTMEYLAEVHNDSL